MPCGGNPVEGIYGRCIQRIRTGARIVAITPEGIKLEHSFRLGFKAFNTEAEYEALLA